jgi:hypothetical protein
MTEDAYSLGIKIKKASIDAAVAGSTSDAKTAIKTVLEGSDILDKLADFLIFGNESLSKGLSISIRWS